MKDLHINWTSVIAYLVIIIAVATIIAVPWWPARAGGALILAVAATSLGYVIATQGGRK